jgi:putative addiction module component (TIGR02574 family)
MAVNLEALGIHRLSVAERLDFIEQIWNSLPEQLDTQEVPEWHLAELAKRRTRADVEPGVDKPWRAVLNRLKCGGGPV